MIINWPRPSATTPAAVAPPKSRRTAISDRPVLQGRDRAIFALLLCLWIPAALLFWFWWLRPEHIASWPLYTLASVALAYDLTLMPLVFLVALPRMRRPDPIEAKPGLRVAMVTAIVPSAEPLDVLEHTLRGMVNVRYPHDTWVLDEGGDPGVRALCARLGASYWTRKGRPEFNQPAWPFQAKTKSGNYNSWFHDLAYDRYDYIVQLDVDHAPIPSYLDQTLGYFQDPTVAYVALPSVYRNLRDWPARGSSEQSQVFQGPIQMAYYGWARTPMIIGSHAVYRLAAIREIGGFAQSRAEDHLDTLKLAKAGYSGVFVPEVLAAGLGPHTLSVYLSQEHQWAFSIAQVLFKYGRDKGLLTWRQRSVFLFSELWYGIFALSYLLLWGLPLVALLTNVPIAHVSFPQFLLYELPLTGLSLVGLGWTHQRSWLKPASHGFVSWQGMVLAAARWPIVLTAIVSAAISVLLRDGGFVYRVTPKGKGTTSSRAILRAQLPILIPGLIPIPIMLGYAHLHGDEPNQVAGYVFFGLVSTVLFTILYLISTASEVRALRGSVSRRFTGYVSASPLVLVGALLLAGIAGSVLRNGGATASALAYRPTFTGTLRGADGGLKKTEEAARPTDPAALPPLLPDAGPVLSGPVDTRVATSPLPRVNSPLFDPGRRGTTFGAYDPSGALADLSRLDHLFASWDVDPDGGLPVARIRLAYASGRPVLLSLEPWPLPGYPGDDLLPAIARGDYDPVIRAEAGTVRSLQQPLLIRFGHEMDLVGVYPWTGSIPAEYVAAYRHVVDVFREAGATNVLWVWSPAGTAEATRYYPGIDYVDYVGTTVLEYAGWERRYAGQAQPRPYTTLVQEKYDVLAGLGKPLIITEAGVDAPPEQRAALLRQMITLPSAFPRLRAVVYFNALNAPNTHDPDRPDWRLASGDIGLLREELLVHDWIGP